MILKLAKRMLTETDARLLAKFAFNLGMKGVLGLHRFRKRLRRGECFPPFMFMSVTSRCNLRCQGCWVTTDPPHRRLSLPTMDRIVRDCKRQGAYFFGILGGEPLMHPDLFDLFEKHRDCYFQLLTNGLLLTDAVAGRLRRLGNVTPLISVEGREITSDERRGGRDVYRQTLEGLDACRRHRLITGVATSVCQSNFDELLTDRFVDELIARGVHYLWYYIYRPVGPDPAPHLALSAEQILALRRFIVRIRTRAAIIVVDSYWDSAGRAFCPAAAGISHHIGPGGDVEPCPPIQFARDQAGDGADLLDIFRNSEFLREFRALAAKTTPGCILMERPDLLRQFMIDQQAWDTSGRGTALKELAAMKCRTSHHLPGQEIPEPTRIYRFMKKNCFFGLGAYG